MRNFLIVMGIIVLAFIGFIIYTTIGKQNITTTPVTPTVTPQIVTPTPTTQELKINLSELSNSSESGTVTFREENGQTQVTIDLTNAPALTSQPAHIHKGSCPNVGEIVYPLTPVLNGKSETTITTTIQQLRQQKPLAINVHRSPSQINIYVACGDITF